MLWWSPKGGSIPPSTPVMKITVYLLQHPGGLLILGVEDPTKAKGADRLYGLSENLEAVAELKRKVKSHFQPAIVERASPVRIRIRKNSQDEIMRFRGRGEPGCIRSWTTERGCG